MRIFARIVLVAALAAAPLVPGATGAVASPAATLAIGSTGTLEFTGAVIVPVTASCTGGVPGIILMTVDQNGMAGFSDRSSPPVVPCDGAKHAVAVDVPGKFQLGRALALADLCLGGGICLTNTREITITL